MPRNRRLIWQVFGAIVGDFVWSTWTNQSDRAPVKSVSSTSFGEIMS
jgi:hypothetical protein